MPSTCSSSTARTGARGRSMSARPSSRRRSISSATPITTAADGFGRRSIHPTKLMPGGCEGGLQGLVGGHLRLGRVEALAVGCVGRHGADQLLQLRVELEAVAGVDGLDLGAGVAGVPAADGEVLG